MFFILGLILSLFLGWFYSVNKRNPLYPPLPRMSFPILGHLPYILMQSNTGIHPLLQKWSREYKSPIIGVDFANFRCVIISDSKFAKQAFFHSSITGRPISPLLNIHGMEDGLPRGVGFSQGHRWLEQKRFTLMHLKSSGFGKSSMEAIIQRQAQELVSALFQQNRIPISTDKMFFATSVNTIWEICTKSRVRSDDPEMLEWVDLIKQNNHALVRYSLLLFVPWLCKYVPKYSGFQEYVNSTRPLFKRIESLVEQRYQIFCKGGRTQNDFIDVYLNHIINCSDKSSSFFDEEGKKNLCCTLENILMGGTDTTSTTMSFLCLYLALHPKVQESLHREIDKVIGQDRTPSFSDKSAMPYTQACILETLRKSSIAPLGLPHRTVEDVQLNDVFIPKNTIVLFNIMAVHHEKEIWGEDVNFFIPERFLSNDKTKIVNSDKVFAFSVGKRACIGEHVAKMELFLFTAYILQKFNILIDPNSPIPSMKPKISGFVALPLPHKLVFVDRFGS